MKKITSIEFVNYKAFYGKGEQNIITIPEGRNLLIYGENGSGKTSIFEGLKQFFNSTSVSYSEKPAKHIRVPKSYVVNEGTADQEEIINEISVKLTFQNEDGTAIEELIYGNINSTNNTSDYVRKANQLKNFLSYRELLNTYLMSNLKDRTEFRQKFAILLIETILAEKNNSGTSQSYIKSWADFFIPRAWASNKTSFLASFTIGLKQDIRKINLYINEFLTFFSNGLSVELKLIRSEIIYKPLERDNRMGYYPICEIDLDVMVNGEIIEDDIETHLTVLNEARLSALAISIYLSALVITPQEGLNYKLLFLDDIFIGLDLSNRLPLLKILSDFKKPIFENGLDAQNHIVEKIKEVDGVKQYESKTFFDDYQIFLSTYDRFWFETAKRYFETHNSNKWHFLEMFSNREDGLNFDTPIVYTSANYLQKANLFLSKHDYPSCAIHLRKAVEDRIKLLLPVNEHYSTQTDQNTGVQEFKKLKTLSQYIDKYIEYCKRNDVDVSELVELRNLKDWYFNPFSHDNIGTPVFKREVEIAMDLVEKLNDFNFKVILSAGELLQFNFNNVAGETRHYKIELIENLRCIKSKGVDVLSNPRIKCVEWIKNGNPQDVSNWGQEKLFRFYNNKRNTFLNINDQVPNSIFWDELIIMGTGQPLQSLLIQ